MALFKIFSLASTGRKWELLPRKHNSWFPAWTCIVQTSAFLMQVRKWAVAGDRLLDVCYNFYKRIGRKGMKTFKILSLTILNDGERVPIPLIDGLILNKEDGRGTWLIEAYTESKHLPFFAEKEKQQTELDTEVVITYENNDPAPLSTRVRGIKEFDGTISVLLEGKIRSRRIAYAEKLLEELVREGYEGEELIEAFKERLNGKGRSAS